MPFLSLEWLTAQDIGLHFTHHCPSQAWPAATAIMYVMDDPQHPSGLTKHPIGTTFHGLQNTLT